MTIAIDRAAAVLFSEGRSTLNVRFLCGGSDNVSAERLAERVILSEAAIRGDRARRIDCVDAHLTSLAG